MSVRAVGTAPARIAHALVGPRAFALAGGTVLTLSYLSVLYRVVDVVGGAGGTGVFVAVVLGSLALGAVCARAFGSGWAVALGAVLLAAGLLVYLLAVPRASIDVGKQVADTASLLSGMSVLRVTRAGVWALATTPGPVFLSWYFFARRAYARGVLVGGAALAVFALTGDVETVPALVGVLGGVAAVGFGQLDREGADPELRDALVVVLVAMLVVTTSASLVPGGEARPLLPSGGSTTVEASLTSADARVDVVGSISLSPERRFTVAADESRYWRAGAYDRYTGDGWVRTGQTSQYPGELPRPEADEARPLQQTFEAESSVSTMPAAWKPIRVETAPGPVAVTDLEGLQPRGGLAEGERYSVVSLVPERSPARLRNAGTDYPPAVEERYLALPESTPERLERFTSNLTEDDDTPYAKATRIQEWLQSEKEYALDVDRPDGDVASAFVFEMDAGYCTYYATAMVAMLRSQGVPARFVVGYLPGEQVDDEEWLVRGLDSHAWVEVYFPGSGWVRFDPTPAEPRQSVERERLAQARAVGEDDLDGTGSPTSAATTTTSEGTPADGASDGTESRSSPASPNGSGAVRPPGDDIFGASGVPGGGDDGPTRETILYGLVLLLGLATAAYRLGIAERLYRALWLRRLPAGPPGERVEAAVERGEYLLGRRYRPRRDGETRREYLAALEARGVDERATALFRLHERAIYAGRATEREGSEAGRLLRELRAESGRLG